VVPGDRLYADVPAESLAAARLGHRRLADACAVLRDEGVLGAATPIPVLANSMFTALDLEDLAYACA
jgi:hypothetical protein